MKNTKVTIAGVEFKNPVMTASGTFGSGMEYSEFVDLNKLGAVVTKGVANMAQDPAINQSQVLGKVIGNISIVSFALKVITNIYVWMFIPVVILVKKNIKRIINIKAEKE